MPRRGGGRALDIGHDHGGVAGVSRNTMQQLLAERMASSMASLCPEATGIPVTPSGFRNR